MKLNFESDDCGLGLASLRHLGKCRIGWVRRYAQRYGLFTLVGIAGEDDVDAPELGAPTQQPLGRERLKPGSNGRLDRAKTEAEVLAAVVVAVAVGSRMVANTTGLN